VVPCDVLPGERDKLAAFMVPTPAGRGLLEAHGKVALNARLRAVLADAVDAVALPRRWRYLDQMPVDAQGKTTVAALFAQAEMRPRFARMREVEAAPGRVVLELTVPADLLYFDGHFDCAPILPGVVQVDWAIHYGRRFFPLPPQFAGMHALEFHQVIVPGQTVLLELLHDGVTGSLTFLYHSTAGKHASGRVLFAVRLCPPC
jgi:3-hydroxymyristoyl/3-hydroxydecanoyl-(acyl carrier protein) dehydratase